jgi:small subunit ribosomal protein S20
MANTASARKRIRQNVRRNERNTARRSRMRSFIRKVEEAIESGDKAVAAEALKAAQPVMQRTVTKGVAHKNTVARKLSRLSARVKAIGAV